MANEEKESKQDPNLSPPPPKENGGGESSKKETSKQEEKKEAPPPTNPPPPPIPPPPPPKLSEPNPIIESMLKENKELLHRIEDLEEREKAKAQINHKRLFKPGLFKTRKK